MDQIFERLESLDRKMDKMLQRTTAHKSRLDSHGYALKWVFGILGSVVVGIIIKAVSGV